MPNHPKGHSFRTAPIERRLSEVPATVAGRSRIPPLEANVDYRKMSSEAKAAFLAERRRCELCGRPSVLVDHDDASHEVRGALCRRCNSRLGSLEAALRLPATGAFQTMAHDLHTALERGERLSRWVDRADLAYLGIPGPEYKARLRKVHALLVGVGSVRRGFPGEGGRGRGRRWSGASGSVCRG
ncbi:endonuclease domain-containing protein [Kitasatospora sp. NPDC001159]